MSTSEWVRKCIANGAYKVFSGFPPKKIASAKEPLDDLESKLETMKRDFNRSKPNDLNLVPIVLGASNATLMWVCVPDAPNDSLLTAKAPDSPSGALPQQELPVDENALKHLEEMVTLSQQAVQKAIDIGNQIAAAAATAKVPLSAEEVERMARESPDPQASRRIAARARGSLTQQDFPGGTKEMGGHVQCATEFISTKTYELRGFVVTAESSNCFIAGSCDSYLEGFEELRVTAPHQMNIRFDPSTTYGRLFQYAKATNRSIDIQTGVAERLRDRKKISFLIKIHTPDELLADAFARLQQLKAEIEELN